MAAENSEHFLLICHVTPIHQFGQPVPVYSSGIQFKQRYRQVVSTCHDIQSAALVYSKRGGLAFHYSALRIVILEFLGILCLGGIPYRHGILVIGSHRDLLRSIERAAQRSHHRSLQRLLSQACFFINSPSH